MEVMEQRVAPYGVAVAVVVASAVTVAVWSSSGWWLLLPVGALILVGAWLQRTDATKSSLWLAVVCWASVGIVSAVSFGLIWPIPQLVGLGVAAIVLRRQRVVRPRWLDRGVADRFAVVLAIVSVPLTTLALVTFISSGRTDLETATEGLSSLPLWVLPLAGLGFVIANPTVEEVLFRGALQTVITQQTGSPIAGVVIQGLAFGAIHLNGVPGGPLGMVMAGVWGVVLGVVTHRTKSVRLAWIVHVFANVAIFSTVTALALRDGIL